MKTFLLLGTLLMGVAQADPEPATPPPSTASAPQTAAGMWQHLTESGAQLSSDLQTHNPAIQVHVPTLRNDIRDYLQKYPGDEHAGDAKLMAVQLDQLAGSLHLPDAPTADQTEHQFEALAADQTLPQMVRAQAAMMTIIPVIEKTKTGGKAALDDLDAKINDFEKTFGAVSFNGKVSALAMLRSMELKVLEQKNDVAGHTALLNRLAKDPQPDIAALAQKALEAEKATAGLKAAPLDLKFTAVDGSAIDLAQMRGKVVLIDFWATWCPPCREEVPDVVAAYQKFHSQGFEIVGISLDQDKGALTAFTKKNGMAWPQYFDGLGWDNAISKRFGISSIPAMWLIGKDGILVTKEGRDDLAGQVQKLLQAK